MIKYFKKPFENTKWICVTELLIHNLTVSVTAIPDLYSQAWATLKSRQLMLHLYQITLLHLIIYKNRFSTPLRSTIGLHVSTEPIRNPWLARPDNKPPCCSEIRHKVPRVHHLYARDPIKQPLRSLQLGPSLNRTKPWKHENGWKGRDAFLQTVCNFWHSLLKLARFHITWRFREELLATYTVRMKWLLMMTLWNNPTNSASWENGVSPLYTGQSHWPHY